MRREFALARKARHNGGAFSTIMEITVSIVEDDQELRDSIARYLSGAKGFRLLSTHSSAEAALEKLPGHHPDVVLMDINLPRKSGIECVRELKNVAPSILVVMLTVYEDSQQIFQALAAGACGYLVKRVAPEEVLEAIKEVHRGGSPMSSHIARKVVQSFQEAQRLGKPVGSLSPREQVVLEYLTKGRAYKEIADEMSISIETVRTYIRRIYEKLHVRSRTEAVVKYLKK